ncbi:hypothetical protein Glove_353g21 [Diversispora epigaea]|uniref:DDE-1 domain-containing protein n=1 Tax=Diversispora epigaea TaxID=1348612 RepID=A0A397HBG1_9GLOM|nr:hypothetical protein Glove_353g21 [Diversispora epigaea]
MRIDIWKTWLKYHNKGFQIQNYQVLLLVDNVSSYTSLIYTYSLITDENNIDESDLDTNSIQESLKLRIIKGFKAKYKHYYCQHVLDQFEQILIMKNKNKINIKEVIEYVTCSWDAVTTITIQNCWKKTGILPDLINNKTYINAINEPFLTENILFESEIITIIVADNEIENNLSPDFEEKIEELPLPSVTSKKVLNALKVLIRYEEQLSDNDDYNKVSSNDLSKRLSLYK